MNGNRWVYFKDDEVQGLDTELVASLDLARGKSGVPFIITSGLRTQDQNQECGGVHDSAHMTGNAVDLRCDDSASRFMMVNALIQVGFCRIGLYASDGHLHCDNSKVLPQNVIWVHQ